jgi:cyclopropane-fatty-acyl-phospholipid synthase
MITTISLLQDLLPCLPGVPYALRLWDGGVWESVPGETAQFTLVINEPTCLHKLFSRADQLTLGEAFVHGDFHIEGDIFAAFHLADHLVGAGWGLLDRLRYGWRLLPVVLGKGGACLPGLSHSRRRDKAAISFHYDVGNEFYGLWLDRRMVYSCAYFVSADDDIHTAQLNKLDYICRKLRLKPGGRLLDVGCGWGGLILHAAERYGVTAVGITLSNQQTELARERIARAGLESRCSVMTCDYRDVTAAMPFDSIVSVGMFEHVGRKRLGEYFRRAWQLLRPGGTFLNHGIACNASDPLPRGPSFIDRHVFPDGELLPVGDVLRSAESAGFEVRDLESLREHYALTLRHWVRRLEKRGDAAKKLTDDMTYRIWLLYMAGSAHGFETGRLNVYQVLMQKQNGAKSGLPMTRLDWYLD